MSRRRTTFVDSSAWIALTDVGDAQHPAAQSFFREVLKARGDWLTTDYVLDETYTLLRRRRRGLEMARSFHQLVEESRLIEVADVDPPLRQQAWEIFTTYRDKVLSFTDCTSFALMRERRLLEAFTCDRDFQRLGFVVYPS